VTAAVFTTSREVAGGSVIRIVRRPGVRRDGSKAFGRARMATGSNYRLGVDFQPFGINDLEMVAQNSASWNQVGIWLKQIQTLRP
jgi:hypothetical protein